MRYATWALVGMLMVSGCSGLILRDDDSTVQTIGKVSTRIVLFPITFFGSEIAIALTRQEEEHAERVKAFGNAPVYSYGGVPPSYSPSSVFIMPFGQSSPAYQQRPLPQFNYGTMHMYTFPSQRSMTCFNGQFSTNCY